MRSHYFVGRKAFSSLGDVCFGLLVRKVGRKIVKQDVDTKLQLSFFFFGVRLEKLEFCFLGNGGKIFAEIMKVFRKKFGVFYMKNY